MSIKAKLLLVDDEPKILTVNSELLELEGYETRIALGGEKAIQALSKNSYDLVLMDLNMPEVNGLDVMEYINNNEIDVRVIVVSGEVSFEWVSQAFYLGASDYVKKPYEFDGLLNTIKNVIEKSKLEEGFKKLQSQLEQSEKLHRFMIESSPDIIFIVDEQGCFTFANNRAEELLGYRKDELIGKHFSCIVDPEYIDAAEYCFHERRGGQRAQKDEEIWLICKPGMHLAKGKSRIAIELNSLGVYDSDEEENSDNSDSSFSGTYIVARDITERLASEKLIHYQAYHDLLTGLPNRALFLDRLNTAISNCRHEDDKLTVMFLDLDRFKIVNDTLGHGVGDELLKQAANRLKLSIRKGDSLARLGGDEFIVLLPTIESNDIGNKVAKKIVESIKSPFMIEGHEIFITASVGIALFPDDGRTAEELIKNSDIAMYHTKEQGKNGFSQYKNKMSIEQHRALSLENDVRRGIKENQFEIFYQPQVHASNGKIVGMEALLRWNHPQKGLLIPAFFLPMAEESNLIIELGDWVVNSALSDMRRWRDSNVDVGKLAINFSSKQIEQENFVDKIIRALNKYNFPGSNLEIEITESTLMRDIENTVVKLKQLNDVGVHIAIDDFGTGYSSLSLLQKLPINSLKIDKSFIQDMKEDSDRSIIEAIIHMAKGLKLGMVAEGVEEEYQLDYLRQLECQIIQGYIYSEGVPADKAKKIIQDGDILFKGNKQNNHLQYDA